jgi:hypothetical protein
MLVAERTGVSQKGLRADQILTGPLFNLETTRDVETRNLVAEYKRLVALVRMATPQEQEAARTAYSLIHDFATESLKNLSRRDHNEGEVDRSKF